MKIVRLKVYIYGQSDDLGLESRSQEHDNIKFNLYIQTWHDGRLMDRIYAYACFDDLDLDARSQWVGKCGNKNHGCMLSTTTGKQ